MSMPILIVVCLLVIIAITVLFLTAVNWGYKVEHKIDQVTHDTEIENPEVKV